MTDLAYISRVEVEPVEGKTRRAHLPAEEEPVLFGVHGEVAEHYGVSPDVEKPHSSTLLPAADYSAPLPARWWRVKSPSIKIASTPIPSER